MANEENLRPLGSGMLSPEEERAIRSKGGKASQEVLRQRRFREKVKEEFQWLLSLPYKPGELEEIKSLQDLNNNTSVSTKIYMKLISDYMKTGNPRLLELIMRYSGGADDLPQEGDPLPEENALIQALNEKADEVWNEGTEK